MEAIFWIVILTNGDICRSQKSPSLYSSVFPTFFFLSVKSDPYPGILAVYLMDVCSDIETCHAQIRYTLTLACRVRVASWFGVPGTVLNRFRSYLSCCCFRIKYNNNIFFSYVSLRYLQCSLFFIMYTTLLSTSFHLFLL